MNIIEAIFNVFTWSQMSAEERAVTKKLFSLYGWRLFILACVVYASGLIPGTGFVRASDLATIQADMKSVKAELVSKRQQELPRLILDATERWCAASGDVKRLRFESLDTLRAEYARLLGREFERVKCEDLK